MSSVYSSQLKTNTRLNLVPRLSFFLPSLFARFIDVIRRGIIFAVLILFAQFILRKASYKHIQNYVYLNFKFFVCGAVSINVFPY